ncbi:MAG: aminotransferase class I/II-fold pyridoxal phosphate-dependent enzyme, partial [Burkholderiales bacterium]|nr:aminotransferase class I/II-fold pyridoxal phosphate-dependent enzyme [Burkholderiales bacterium]
MNTTPNSMHTPSIQSRLPNMGTTIFSVMSALAQEKGAVNLGQGFPDFACDPQLLSAVNDAMQAGHNQYPLMTGAPVLRQAIAAKIAALYQHQYNANTEITITAGATQALLTAILCCVHAGDEVVYIEPALIINSPHNPTGSILRPHDMHALRDILAGTDIILLSDEVYEHMVYDGQQHESVCRYPDLAARAFVVSSFGKTYHVTGWKVGYVAAPAAMMAEFRKIHQYNVFTVNTPMQHGLASYMSNAAPYLELPQFYQRKRDLFRAGLAHTRFELLPADGTYFQSVPWARHALSGRTGR